MMPSILRHTIIISARSSSSSGRATLLRHYSAAAAVSSTLSVSLPSTSRNNSGASAAGIQTYINRQRIYAPPPYRSYYYASGGISSIRSMVTVTQTSASEKSTPPQAINDNNSSAATSPETISNIEDNGGLNITSSCASRIRQLASSRPNPDLVYLRLYVDAGGCSGFQYKFLLLSEDNSHNANDDEDEEEDGTIDPEEDIIFTKDGMRVVVDQTSLDLLRGSTIDYVQEMIRSSFAVVGNPQSESACGCGSSFAVKNFEANPALD